MKNMLLLLLFFTVTNNYAQPKNTSGNPVFPGWYADPEAVIFDKTYWIYPTYSAPYDKQVFFDAFSSSDLVHWTKHERILDTTSVSWAQRAMWAPAIIEKGEKYFKAVTEKVALFFEEVAKTKQQDFYS